MYFFNLNSYQYHHAALQKFNSTDNNASQLGRQALLSAGQVLGGRGLLGRRRSRQRRLAAAAAGPRLARVQVLPDPQRGGRVPARDARRGGAGSSSAAGHRSCASGESLSGCVSTMANSACT